MKLDAFFASVRGPVFGGKLSQRQVDGCKAILDEAGKRGTPLNHLAYILATAHHESAATMQPVRETLASTDDKAIAILDRAWAAGKLKGVSKPYWRKDSSGRSWLGRGVVQVTHKPNYDKFGITNPADAMKASVSTRVIFDGMTKGMFTGKKLSDFITPSVQDYYSARAIVNGDKKKNGASIAVTAKAFEKALIAAGYDGKPITITVPVPTPKPTAKGAGLVAIVLAALAAVGAWFASIPCSIFEVFCR